jgi:sulfatase modifying factor 1
MKSVISLLLGSQLLAVVLQAQPLVNIETVFVGDAGNAADTRAMSDGTSGYGAVPHGYNIGKYEVTIGQYVTFLNTVAKTSNNAYITSLWKPSMATDPYVSGISRSGSGTLANPYVYAPIGSGNRPIAYVSWLDAARFANWIHNGATNGASTETGAYTLNGATNGIINKNPAAKWWIPSENEWYKAAFYKGGGTNAGYWTYTTESDAEPGNLVGSDTNRANFARYDGSKYIFSTTQSSSKQNTNYLTDVGSFSGSPGPYGTFDQGGNLYEWNDSVVLGTNRGLRGGSWDIFGNTLYFSYRGGSYAPEFGSNILGFRLANSAPVDPENDGLVGLWKFDGDASDASPSLNHAVVNGAAFTSDRFGNPNSALKVTAAGRWRAGGAYTGKPIQITGNASRTISYWAKFSERGTGSGGGTGTYTQSSVSWGVDAEGVGLSYWSTESGGTLWFNAVRSDLYLSEPSPLVPFDKWRMVTFVYSGMPRTAVMYINGVANTSFHPGFWNPESFDIPLNTVSTEVGMTGGQGDFIDDVRIYNRALSAAEISQLYQTEVGDLDSDGDGLTDGWEQGYGRYQFVEGNFTWQQAKADAESKGGHLGTITSQLEYEFLRGVFPKYANGSLRPWLGASDAEQEGVWRWVTGEVWEFSRWDSLQPDNQGGAQHYLWSGLLWNGSENQYWDDYQNEPSSNMGQNCYLLEFGYPTDPLKTDSDGDGFNDRVETDSGTDPNNPESKPGLPALRIEEPVGKGLANSARAKTFGNLLAGTASTGRIYTIRNTGAGPLTSIALTKVGSHTSDFTITGPETNELAPGASTTFSVSFAPATGGTRTAQISIASNDTNRSPFLINLSGFGIGFNVDSDKDGLSDAAEFLLKMYASNFDWQAKQPELVGMLISNVNPAGFFTKAQHDANFVSGRATGRSDVTNNPASYNLVSRTNIPPVRVAMPRSAAFAVNLGGSWTRYAQSGASAGWSFNTNTGVLSGLTPTRGERSVRIVPYNGSQAGPQMTIQVRPAP